MSKIILVPTDFSDTSTHAVRFAGRLALRHGASVRLIYADHFIPPVDFPPNVAGIALTVDQAVDDARVWLIDEANRLLPESVPFETQVLIDAAVPAIVDEARQCDAWLVVMGTHGRTGFRRLILGSITEAVMRMVNKPLIAVGPQSVRAQTSSALPRVVVPFDYSAECLESLQFAASMSDADGQIICVRTVDSDAVINAGIEIYRMQEWLPPELMRRCQFKVLPGDSPAEEIVELARLAHADLIAAGTTSHRTTAEVIRGTLAERIVERSELPVLIVNEMTVLARLAGKEMVTA
jgi:nucleotide-binding universal stress UspA family protein